MAQSAQKDPKQVVVELTMSLDQARLFTWQGARAPREPMGKLLDSKLLDWRDLAWAAQAGYDPKFREAARTLLACVIGQQASPRYGPKVIEGSHFLEEQEMDSMAIIMGMFGYMLGAGIILLYILVQQVVQTQNLLMLPLSLAFMLVIGWVIWKLYIRREIEKYKTFKSGREGEEEIVDRIRMALDNRWTIFRNLHLPGHKDDIDIVLAGPGGIWAVEVKSAKQNIRVQGKKWEIKTKSGWRDVQNNPAAQVTSDARQLNDFFKRHGIVRWVERAIALASLQPVTDFEESEIPVWLLPTIETQAGALTTRTPPAEKELEQANSLLQELATKQIAQEEAKYK